MRIGVPLVGDDGANPPVLARKLTDNIRGNSGYGDYRSESPPAELIRALRRGEIDIAIAWGPLAGYYAARSAPALAYAPIRESEAPPGLTFALDISLAVRRPDQALREELDGVLIRRRAEIATLLDRYHVPRFASAGTPAK